jgi:hypothetical protein
VLSSGCQSPIEDTEWLLVFLPRSTHRGNEIPSPSPLPSSPLITKKLRITLSPQVTCYAQGQWHPSVSISAIDCAGILLDIVYHQGNTVSIRIHSDF